MSKNDEDWAPSLHLGYDKLKPERSKDARERDKKAENREREKRLSTKGGRMKLPRKLLMLLEMLVMMTGIMANGIKKHRPSKLVML